MKSSSYSARLFARDVPKKVGSTSPEVSQRMVEVGVFDVTTEPLEEIASDKYDQKRYIGTVSGDRYIEALRSESAIIVVQESPEKNTERADRSSGVSSELRFCHVPSIAVLKKRKPELLMHLKTEFFNFSVNQRLLEKRAGVKRERSQIAVIGRSALDIFRSYGAYLSPKVKAHLAHRQGHCLGGKQVPENLDVGLAGSNYTTFMKIEKPLKDLVKSSRKMSVKVEGVAVFHPLRPVPIEIRYTLNFPNKKKVRTSTFPLEPRKPTLIEHQLASFFFRLTSSRSNVEEQSQARKDVSTNLFLS